MVEQSLLSAVEEEILALERLRLGAIVSGDLVALSALMSDDVVILHGSGLVEERANFLEIFERTEFQSIEVREVRVRTFGDSTAVVTSVVDMTARPVGAAEYVQGGQNQTCIWCRDETGWLFNTLHNTRLPSATT